MDAAALVRDTIYRSTILLGKSGMGKSTLVNLLVPDADAATREISVNAQSAAQGNETLVANIGSLRDAIGETNTSAAWVLAAAGELTATAETLSREVENFFRDLRSGPADRRKAA